MREIKFRAWDKNRNKWWQAPFLVAGNGQVFLDEFILSAELEIGQYTGLKDNGDKEIHEGDIVEDIRTKEMGSITFFRGGFQIECLGKSWPLGDFSTEIHLKVIGNIYENPELLPETT